MGLAGLIEIIHMKIKLDQREIYKAILELDKNRKDIDIKILRVGLDQKEILLRLLKLTNKQKEINDKLNTILKQNLRYQKKNG